MIYGTITIRLTYERYSKYKLDAQAQGTIVKCKWHLCSCSIFYNEIETLIFFTAFITITNVATGNNISGNGPKPHFMEKCFPYVNKYARSVMDLVTLYVRFYLYA